MGQTWLAPHLAVAALTPDESVLTVPDGTKLRLKVPVETTLRLLDRLAEPTADEQVAPAAQIDTDTWTQLRGPLERHGALLPAETIGPRPDRRWLRYPTAATSRTRRETAQMVVVGRDELAGRLARALAGADFAVRTHTDLDEVTTSGHHDVAAGPVVLCTVHRDAHQRELGEVEETVAALRLPWVPIRVHGYAVHVGPAIQPGVAPRLRDVLQRRLAAAPTAAAWESTFGAPVLRTDDWLRPSELEWAAVNIVVAVERWLLAEPTSLLAANEIVFQAAAGTTEHHTVLALPDAPSTLRRRPRPTSRWNLLDAQTGIVTGVQTPPVPDGLPATLHVAVARAADMRRTSGFPNDRTGFGTSWVDAESATGPAIGEIVERYCANRPAQIAARDVSWEELSRRGVDALHPDTLVGYSTEQLAHPGFPFAAFTASTPVSWARAVEVGTGRSLLVPACWVYVSWNEQEHAAEPRLVYPNLAGISAGTDLEMAVKAALLENIERDASMVWWAHTPALPPHSPSEVCPEVAAAIAPDRWEAHLVHLSSRFGVHVVAGITEDRSTGVLTAGFAARESFAVACRKALAESFSLQWTARTMAKATPDSAAARAIVDLRNLKPFRADGRYLDAYRADFRDVKDLACQLQVYLDPRAGRFAKDVLGLGRAHARPPAVEDFPAATSAEIAARIATETGVVPSVVDLSTDDIVEAGYRAVRVLTPGLVPNYPAAFPQLGRDRVRDGHRHFGWSSVRRAGGALNTFPLAHY